MSTIGGTNGITSGITSGGSMPTSVMDAINGTNIAGAGKKGEAGGIGPQADLKSALSKNNALGASTATGANGAPTVKSAEDMQSTFMKLLVTEMKNQDPTNPMDSSQMTSQLAQINTVSGIAGLNTTLSSLATQLNATSQVSAASLIGKSVLANGNEIAMKGGKPSAFGVQMGAAAETVKVTVSDASGHPVRTMALGAQPTGMQPLTWDGKTDAGKMAADGKYTFKVSAANGADPVTATALAQSQVKSVVQQASGTTGLVLENGATTSLSSVAQIL